MMEQSRDALNPIRDMADGQTANLDVAVAEKRPLRTAAFPPLSRIECPGLELVTSSKHEPALLLLREEQLDFGAAVLTDALLGQVDRL